MARLKFGALTLLGLLAPLTLSTPVLAAKKKPKVAEAPAPVQPSVRAGVDLWRAGDFPGAVAMWTPFANGGDADAMFNIGQAYKLGRAVPKDVVVARDWYRRAALKGHLPAQANLGILLFQAGEKQEAIRWLRAAADKNEMRAQYVLGVANWNGDSIPRNLTLAYAYLSRAAAQGLPEGASALANLNPNLSAIERANGAATAASLAAGTGVPAVFGGPPPVALAATADRFNRDQVLKAAPLPAPVPAPVQTAATPPVAAPAPAPAAPIQPVPVQTAANRPVPAPAAAVRPPVQTATAQPAPAAVTRLTPATSGRPAAPAVRTVDIPAGVSQQVAAAPVAAQAPRPVARPTEVAAVAARPAPKPAARPVRKEPLEWRVQLGAFSKKALAEAAWDDVKVKQKQLVAASKPIFNSDGAVTKLQMGPFASREKARDACARIAFSGRACFVTEG